MAHEGKTLAVGILTNIPTRGVNTIYSRIGDLFAYLCLAALVLLTVRAFTPRKQPAAPRRAPVFVG
jgi:apolipoprotein N-acyltransferase